jgi:hypothetical protein
LPLFQDKTEQKSISISMKQNPMYRFIASQWDAADTQGECQNAPRSRYALQQSAIAHFRFLAQFTVSGA